MKKYILLGSLILFSSACSFNPAKNEDSRNQYEQASIKKSFLPENDFDKRTYYAAGEVTEDDFDAVLQAADEIYSPILSNLGLNLTVNGDWSSKTVNAYCNREGNDVEVSFFGGLAKHPKMTVEGFALVVCHELGHAIGGIPVYSGNSWAAVEGQSDYFATAACARKMFDPSSPLRYWGRDLMKRKKQPTPDQDNSSANCGSGQKGDICKLSLSGGLSLGGVLADLNGESTPRYETPSKVVVSKTMEKHPPAQCRADSYKAGALCNKTWNYDIIPSTKSQENAVSCSKPRCWYSP